MQNSETFWVVVATVAASFAEQYLQSDHHSRSEIDISVSKLLGFETFAKSLRVSVSENLVSEKSLGFGFEKIWSRKKVSVSVSENLVSEKKKSK